MELVFAYIAGLLTLINPCVLPVLPIVLAGAVRGGRHAPLRLAAGMGVSFVTVGMFVLTLGAQLGLTEDRMVAAGAWAMLAFGLILVVPRFSESFATATAGIAARADGQMGTTPGIGGGWADFVGGMLLGAVWSPCVGPTLGGAISLAAQGQSLPWAALIMVFFALGVGTIIVTLGYGTREAIQRRKSAMSGLAARSRPVLGVVFVGVALMILTKTHHRIEAALLRAMPDWLVDLSVAF